MFFEDANYFTRRALSQLECAANASDDGIASIHARLSDMYLERARASVDVDSWQAAEAALAGSTVVPLRIVA